MAAKPKKEPTGFWIPNEIAMRTDLTWHEKAVLARVKLFPSFFAKSDWAAKQLGMSPSGFRNTLSKLRKKGLLPPKAVQPLVAALQPLIAATATISCSDPLVSPMKTDSENRRRVDIEKKFAVGERVTLSAFREEASEHLPDPDKHEEAIEDLWRRYVQGRTYGSRKEFDIQLHSLLERLTPLGRAKDDGTQKPAPKW